ncbi:MAG: hypothetical protein KKC77_19635 [Proteobacteria bacterium]|nr:hypothetical protein [Pseudomonadota bacterium]
MKTDNSYDQSLLAQAFTNELLLEFKRKNFDYLQKARMIKYLVDEKKISLYKLAQELGISKQEVLKINMLNKVSDKIIGLIVEGKIQASMVADICYRLKDWSKLEIVIDETIKEKPTWKETHKTLSQLNNPESLGNHIKTALLEFNQELSDFLSNPLKFKAIDVKKRFEIVTETKTLIKKLEQLKKLLNKK